jgi:hypothetical protein
VTDLDESRQRRGTRWPAASKPAPRPEFDELRPRLKVLLELHRAAESEADRAALMDMFADVFLSTAWHVAQDLLENGWTPGFASASGGREHLHLRVVEGENAA